MTKNYTFCDDTVSDLHKDAYGFRPDQSFWNYFAAANADQKQTIWDDLLDTLDATIAREKEDERQAIRNFEERMATVLKSGARTFDMAIRWLHEAYDTQGDDEFLEFCLGLPFGHIAKARDTVHA